MKKLLIFLTSILVSFNTYSEWTEIAENTDGDSYFIELDTIKNNNEHLDWWVLTDYIEPTANAHNSSKIFYHGDCNKKRYKQFFGIWYKELMGNGFSEIHGFDSNWVYPSSGTIGEFLLNYACDYVD
jgi:hypothetical protein